MTENVTAEIALVNQFLADPSDRNAKSALNIEYWKLIEAVVRSKCLDGGAENLNFTPAEKLQIDLGLINEEMIDKEKVNLERLKLACLSPSHPEGSFHFSGWLNVQFEKILKKPEKEKLKMAVDSCDVTLSNLQSSIYEHELEREKVFGDAYMINLYDNKQFSLEKQKKGTAGFKDYKDLDNEFKKIETTKRFVENGKFMTPEEKREFISSQKDYEKRKNRIKESIAELNNETAAAHIDELTARIEETIIQISLLERRRERVSSQLTDLIKKVEAMSAVEIENALTKVVGFHRDMVKLCANRKKIEPMSVLNGESDPFTLQEISKIVKFVVEYDPRLFKNERVNISGIPSILIVPGYGNGMYDWKYNTLLIPTMPYRDKLVSVLSSIVEYKLDCDEDKILLHSYNKLKDYAGVRSGFALKDKFHKDYTIFIRQEAKGYKVLPKDIRLWFNRYIAPKKREIKFPMEIDPRLMSKEDYQELKATTEQKIEKNQGTSRDYFVMGTIQHYYDENRDALNSFIRSIKIDNTGLNSLFNGGIMAMKLKEKEVAVKFFGRHLELEPQSWWSNVCRDHILDLQK